MKYIFVFHLSYIYCFSCCSTEWNLNPRWTDMGNGVLSPITCPEVYKKTPAGRKEYVSNWKYSVNGLKFKSHTQCRKFIKRCISLISSRTKEYGVFKEKNCYIIALKPIQGVESLIYEINNLETPRNYEQYKFQLNLEDTILYFD